MGCWTIQIQSAQQTLDGIPKPLAVLSANDMRGLQVIDACSLLEIQVPEEVSVLGVITGFDRRYQWHSLKPAMDESVVCFFSRGSNLESVDCASFVKITRNDPVAVSVSVLHRKVLK